MTGEEMRDIGLRAWGRCYPIHIARRIGVDVRTVRRYARGKTLISDDRADAIRTAAENKRRAGAFAASQLDHVLAEAAAAGLDRAEVLAALAERALVLSAVATLASRRTAKP